MVGAEAGWPAGEAAIAIAHIMEKAQLAEFTVVDNVDAVLDLLGDDIIDRLSDVGWGDILLLRTYSPNAGRPGEGADMRNKNSTRASQDL
jgi:hypothetical protein